MNSGKFPVGICTAVTFRSANLILCEAGRCCRNHISVHADLLSLVLRHQFPMLGASKRSQGQDKSLDKRGFPIRGFTSVLDAVGGFIPLPFVHPVSHVVANALERSEVCMYAISSTFY